MVRPSVGPSVMLSSKSLKYGLCRIPNDLDIAGRGKRGTRGRRDEESEKMKKLLKNEKVAKGRIIGLAGPC